MSCRNIEEKLHELHRCGCRRCEEEYYHLRDRLYDRDRYRVTPYIIPSELSYRPNAVLKIAIDYLAAKEPKMEEPKNIAVRLLVDKLKSEQGVLASNSTSLASYEKHVKTYREAKNKNLRAIKELATALKKLGHKNEK